VEARPDRPVSKIDFTDAMKDFLTRTAVRVKGFDLSDTQDYYKQIVSRAWKEAQAIGEIEQKDQFLDKNMEWVLMHDDYPTVFQTPRHVYYPIWTRPIYTGGGIGTGSAPQVGGGKSSSGGSGPGLGDVAGGFAGWAENTMAGLAGAILPGKISAPGSGGVINLSGLDKATGDFFEALSKSSGSGGGGSSGGGCACACAGCACACACAGGGR
jgi:hypothetical protein